MEHLKYLKNLKKQKMKTSKEWWDDTKQSPEKIINWLKNQYHGEAVAAERIKEYIRFNYLILKFN